MSSLAMASLILLGASAAFALYVHFSTKDKQGKHHH